jgi:hypothetical protein
MLREARLRIHNICAISRILVQLYKQLKNMAQLRISPKDIKTIFKHRYK